MPAQIKLPLNEIRKLYVESKMCGREITLKLGISESVLYRALSKMGISRNNSEAIRLSMSMGRRKYKSGHGPGWKGGRKKRRGYVEIYSPENPGSCVSGYINEHRMIVSNLIGRKLKTEEQVHHINGIRDDNRINNLMAFSSQSAHQKYENKGECDPSEIIFNGRDYAKRN